MITDALFHSSGPYTHTQIVEDRRSIKLLALYRPISALDKIKTELGNKHTISNIKIHVRPIRFNDHTAPGLRGSFVRREIDQTNYHLRNTATDLTIPKPKREFLKKSFKYSGAINALESTPKRSKIGRVASFV